MFHVSNGEAAETGIALLHGNCGAFRRTGDPLLRAVFRYWKEVYLKGKNKTQVHKELKKVVEDIIVRWVKGLYATVFNIHDHGFRQASVFQDLCCCAACGGYHH